MFVFFVSLVPFMNIKNKWLVNCLGLSNSAKM